MKVNKTGIKSGIIAAVVVLVLGGGAMLLPNLNLFGEPAPEGAGETLSRAGVVAAESERQEYIDDSEADSTIEYNGHSYALREDLDMLLVFGIDNYELEESTAHRNGQRADMLLVAVFDKTNETYTIVQINRDTITDIMMYDSFGTYEGVYKTQIALAHTYRSGMQDSCEDTVFAVSRFLYGIDIANYFCLTMSSIPILNDSVGGVTVTIKDDFTGIDETLVKGETITLQGDQAEHFVRTRRGMVEDPTNMNRMARQRDYMTSLLALMGEKIATDSTYAVSLYNDLAPYMVTDCDLDQLNNYLEQFSGYELKEIITPEGEQVPGEQFMEFYADEDALMDLVVDTFYEQID